MHQPWQDILDFWFGPEPHRPWGNPALWSREDPDLDREIRLRFEILHRHGRDGRLEGWRQVARGTLGYVILMDQFSRRMYRGHPMAFSQDPQALGAALQGMAQGQDRELDLVERWFYYMPLMHAEDPGIQRWSVSLYTSLLAAADEPERGVFSIAFDQALRSKVAIERFGRFPQRNEVLGRPTTDEERVFLRDVHPAP